MSDRSQQPTRRALFLDRDGTVIVEKHYLSNPELVELLPTAAETIARMNRLGISVIIATNQAGVARGIFPESCVHAVHERLDQLLEKYGAKVDRYEYCPNHPVEGRGNYKVDCGRRKPQPGMLTDAALALDIDLSTSCMIGDRIGDIQAGANAGCQTALVRTGYGNEVAADFAPPNHGFLGAFPTLADAVNRWLEYRED